MENTQPNMLNIAQLFITQKMTESQEIRKKLETSKTEYKKKYYTRKLRENNKELMKALVALDKLRGQNGESD